MDKVGIIFGGKSTEHEVSLASAQAVSKALNDKRHERVMIGITREGKWMRYNGTLDEMTEIEWWTKADSLALEDLQSLDILLPVLHGRYGEDGTIQGLIEMLNIPYAGCGVLASSLAMDKAASKLVFKSCGIPTPDFQLVLSDELQEGLSEAADRCEKTLRYPMFVKPANTGSSVGISKVRNREELEQGLLVASNFDRRIVVENGVDAWEVETGVIGNDRPECAAVGSIEAAHDFYDYTAKYSDDAGTVIQVPAKLDEKIIQEVRRNALCAYKALDCAGCARVDFLVEKSSEKVYLNELNTLPGFTKYSMFPMLWAEVGVSFTELIDRLLDYGYARFEQNSSARVSQ